MRTVIAAAGIAGLLAACANQTTAPTTASQMSIKQRITQPMETATPQDRALAENFVKNMISSGLASYAGSTATMSESGIKCIAERMVFHMTDAQVDAVAANRLPSGDRMTIGLTVVPLATDDCRAAKVIP
jgi:hypothetical protein